MLLLGSGRVSAAARLRVREQQQILPFARLATTPCRAALPPCQVPGEHARLWLVRLARLVLPLLRLAAHLQLAQLAAGERRCGAGPRGLGTAAAIADAAVVGLPPRMQPVRCVELRNSLGMPGKPRLHMVWCSPCSGRALPLGSRRATLQRGCPWAPWSSRRSGCFLKHRNPFPFLLP